MVVGEVVVVPLATRVINNKLIFLLCSHVQLHFYVNPVVFLLLPLRFEVTRFATRGQAPIEN